MGLHFTAQTANCSILSVMDNDRRRKGREGGKGGGARSKILFNSQSHI